MIFSDRTLSQKLERTEASSNAAFVETRARIQPESGAEWMQAAGAYAMFDGIESPLTQTFGLGVFDRVTGDDLNRIEEFFRERGAPILHEVSPLADASLFEMLNERGYQPVEFSSVMYCPLKGEINFDLPANHEIVTRIIEAGEDKLWARTSANGWATEMEGLAEFMFELGQISAKCAGGFPFLAELEGAPISAGMLFVYEGVALLAGTSTIPEGRRRGAQTALLDARLRYAADHGCTIAMMGAAPGSQSQKNAEKNGFRIAYTRTKWQLKNCIRRLQGNFRTF
jgi:GNAT superfamily N-acetyltransferase